MNILLADKLGENMSYCKIKNRKQNSPSSNSPKFPHKTIVGKKIWTVCARNAGGSCRKKEINKINIKG